MQKTLEPSKKMFQFPGWMNIPGETSYRRKHVMQVASK